MSKKVIVTMETIVADWYERVSKNRSALRWIASPGAVVGEVAPRRQVEWKNRANKPAVTFKIAWEAETNRWVLYIFEGATIKAKELVNHSDAIWKVFAFWTKSKKSSPMTIAHKFLARYEGLTRSDVSWMAVQFGHLGQNDMESMAERVENMQAWKTPKTFTLATRPITPNCIDDLEPTQKSTKWNQDAHQPERPIETGTGTPSKVISASLDSAQVGRGKAMDGHKLGNELAESNGPSVTMDENTHKEKRSTVSAEDTTANVCPDPLETVETTGHSAVTASKKTPNIEPKEVSASAVKKNLKRSAPGAAPSTAVKSHVKSATSTSDHSDETGSKYHFNDVASRDCAVARDEDEDDEDEDEDDDVVEDADYEYDTPTSAKWKSIPVLQIPSGAKETQCVYKEDWPKIFNPQTDSVKSYIVQGTNGQEKEKFFVLKPGCEWTEYNPPPKRAPRAKKLRASTQSASFTSTNSNQTVRPRVKATHYGQDTRPDGIYEVPDNYGGYEVEEQITTIDEKGVKTCSVTIIDTSHAGAGPKPRKLAGKGTYTMSREKYIASYKSGYRG